jgi:hypothetical protein
MLAQTINSKEHKHKQTGGTELNTINNVTLVFTEINSQPYLSQYAHDVNTNLTNSEINHTSSRPPPYG